MPCQCAARHYFTVPMHTLRLISSPSQIFAKLCLCVSVPFDTLPPQCGSLHCIAVAVHRLTLRFPCVASPKIALASQYSTLPLLSNALLFLSSAIYSMLYLCTPTPYIALPLHVLVVLRSALPMLCHACPSLFSDYATHYSAIRNYAVALLCTELLCLSFVERRLALP